MSGAADAPTVEVYENSHPEAELTKTHQLSPVMTLDGEMVDATLSVEYKPSGYALAEGPLAAFIATRVEEFDEPEDVVYNLYREIVNAAFPMHAGYDDPWAKVPLVITLEYEVDGTQNSVTLGQYR